MNDDDSITISKRLHSHSDKGNDLAVNEWMENSFDVIHDAL